MERQRNRLGRGYDRTLGRVLPSSRLLSVLCCLLLNSAVYWGTQAATAGRTMVDMTTALDRMLPFCPGWSVVYVGAYLFWAAGYVYLARGRDWYRVMTAEVLAKLVCGACFLLLPTTNQRPGLTGEGLGVGLLGLIYALDRPANLFPSIHCLESWLCCAGLGKGPEVPSWYRALSRTAALLICASTVLIRQHVLADVLAGVLLGEVMLRLSRRKGMGRRLRRWMEGLDRRIFG